MTHATSSLPPREDIVAGPPTLEKLALIDVLVDSTTDDDTVIAYLASALDHALGALTEVEEGTVRDPEGRARITLDTIRAMLIDGIGAKELPEVRGYDIERISLIVESDELLPEQRAILLSEGLELAILALMDVSGDDPVREARGVNKIEKVSRRALQRILTLLEDRKTTNEG